MLFQFAWATDGKKSVAADEQQPKEQSEESPSKASATSRTSAGYKPSAGNFTSEVALNLTGNISTISLNNAVSGLRLRYFLADQLAARLGFNFSIRSESETVNEIDGTGEGEYSRSVTRFGFAPGIEKHFGGSDRVSPYIGAELVLDLQSASEEWTDYDGTGYQEDANVEVSGAWADGSNRGSTEFGLNLVLGGDMYFLEWAYIGVEVGWGFRVASLSTVETTQGDTTVEDDSGPSIFSLRPNFNGGVRMGFAF